MADRLLQGDWSKDLPGLSDEGVLARLKLAQERERASLAKDMGRNPKGARSWRERGRLAQAEADRRRLETQANAALIVRR